MSIGKGWNYDRRNLSEINVSSWTNENTRERIILFYISVHLKETSTLKRIRKNKNETVYVHRAEWS